MVNPNLRTKTVSTKISEKEYAQLEAQAGERGVSLSEWCREVLLAELKPPAANATEEILLAELIALRTILLNVQYS